MTREEVQWLVREIAATAERKRAACRDEEATTGLPAGDDPEEDRAP